MHLLIWAHDPASAQLDSLAGPYELCIEPMSNLGEICGNLRRHLSQTWQKPPNSAGDVLPIRAKLCSQHGALEGEVM